MALTQQQRRLAVCGLVAVPSLSVLLFYRPTAWAVYVAWTVSRIGGSLLLLISGIFLLGVVLTVLSRYRHKPEILAAALALSAALHLLLAAALTLWVVGDEPRPDRGKEQLLEVAPGLPSSIEEMLSREMRTELLEPLLRDEKTLEPDAPVLEPPPDTAPEIAVVAPEPVNLEQQSDEQPLVEVASVTPARTVDIEAPSAAAARVAVEPDSHPSWTQQALESPAELEEAQRSARPQFEEDRSVLEPLSAAEADVPAPVLQTPERTELFETPELPESPAAAVPEPAIRPERMETVLEVVDLDAGQMRPEASTEQMAEEAQARKQEERALAAARAETVPMAVDASVPAVSLAPDLSVSSATVFEMQTDVDRRQNPDDPAAVASSARHVDVDVLTLSAPVRPVTVTEDSEAEVRRPEPVKAFSSMRDTADRAAGASVPVEADAPIQTVERHSEVRSSPLAARAVDAPQPDRVAPRPAEVLPDAMPPRAEADPGESLRMQMALLRTLITPTAELGGATNAVRRELGAGRAAVDALTPPEALVDPVSSRTLRQGVHSGAEMSSMAESAAQSGARAVPVYEEPQVSRLRSVTLAGDPDPAGVVIEMPSVAVASGAGVPSETGGRRGEPVMADAGRAESMVRVTPVSEHRAEAPVSALVPGDVAEHSLAVAGRVSAPSGRTAPVVPAPAATAAGSGIHADADHPLALSGQVEALTPSPLAESGDLKGDVRMAVAASGRLALERRSQQGAAIAGEPVLAAVRPQQVQESTAGAGRGTAVSMQTDLPAIPNRDLPGESRLLAVVGESVHGRSAGETAAESESVEIAAISRPQTPMAVQAAAGDAADRTLRPAVIAPVRTTGGIRMEAANSSGSAASTAQVRSSVAFADGQDSTMAEGTFEQQPVGRSAPRVSGPVAVEVRRGMETGGAAETPVGARMQTLAAPAEVSFALEGGGPVSTDSAPLSVGRAGGTATTDVSGPVPRPALQMAGTQERTEDSLAAAFEPGHIMPSQDRSRAPGVASASASVLRPQADAGEMLVLSLAASTMAVGTDTVAEASRPATRTGVEFRAPIRAERHTHEDTMDWAVPQGGWRVPPARHEQGTSAVRLLPDSEASRARRIQSGELRTAGGAEADSVRRLMHEDLLKAGSADRKAIYELRSPEKRRLIEELGGSPETESAVEQALIWLAGAQSADGRWDVVAFNGVELCGGGGDQANGNVAVSGLTLLAYLGAGYTHLSGQHRETVRKGLDWLIEGQGADGDLRRGGSMYDQAMATAALCESLSLTGDRRLIEPARRAAGFIMEAQTPEAAWRYEPRQDSDTSVLGWQILALKSAEIAGIEVHPRHYAWSGMWLDQVRQGNGGLYSYKPGHGPTPVMTAEGWFSQLFMGEEVRRQGQEESIAYLLENLPVWNEQGRGTVHLYYWYYATLAFRLSEDPAFDVWNASLKRALLRGHRRDGPAAGSWDPVCLLGSRGGRIYSTALAALCLEVYYRYLPLYRRSP